jgi:uncharacterized membrane protein SpoIIM required for sporulation
MLRRAEGGSVRALDDEDLRALPVLYRGALSSLSVARETSLDLELVTYLEWLCARAYFFLYGVRTSAAARLRQFLVHDWPAAVRALWRETIVASLLLATGLVAGYLLVAADPVWFATFVPSELSGGRDFSASAAHLRSTLYDSDGGSALTFFATMLFTHNSRVAIFCFALGFAFGVPTILLLVYQGVTGGAMMALFASRGLGFQFGGWLAIHGTTELFAIAIAAAAGLRIGWSVVFPGSSTRLDAASRSGRTAATAMIGVVIMLCAAGLLEGFGRQLIAVDFARYSIGAAMLGLWLLFYYGPRRRRGAAHG